MKVALVTGISSGIGRSTAIALKDAGYRVFGTVRKPGGEVPDGIERLVLDVTDEASVQTAVAELKSKTGRLDLLVNNAGAALSGAIEEASTEQAQRLFDVNFFGVSRVTRAVLPMMREQGSGRVVIISSVLGFLPGPYLGYYTASKHAVEGYGESLDHEVRGFGVRVVLVEPGFTKTRLDQNSAAAANPVRAYEQARTRVQGVVNQSIESGDDPALIARAVLEAATAEKPKLRYPVGKRAGTLAKLRSLLPSGMFDRSLRSQMRLDG
jgi:NAD(P)-dependent dehydrogenase (short-subunit alcohol dehydrogenase family)